MFPLIKIRIKPCRFPTKEWKALGTFHAREERTVQSFAVGDEEMFAKYVKVKYYGKTVVFGNDNHTLFSFCSFMGTEG